MPTVVNRRGMRAAFKLLTASTLLLTTTACNTPGGLVVPELGAIDYTSAAVPSPLEKAWPDDLKATLVGAFADAKELDRQLFDAMWKNEAYSFTTGLAMFAAGIATLAFGIFDASRTLLLA